MTKTFSCATNRRVYIQNWQFKSATFFVCTCFVTNYYFGTNFATYIFFATIYARISFFATRTTFSDRARHFSCGRRWSHWNTIRSNMPWPNTSFFLRPFINPSYNLTQICHLQKHYTQASNITILWSQHKVLLITYSKLSTNLSTWNLHRTTIHLQHRNCLYPSCQYYSRSFTYSAQRKHKVKEDFFRKLKKKEDDIVTYTISYHY